MTPFVSEWTRARIAAIDHRIRMDKIRAEGQHIADVMARTRRTEEQFTLLSRQADWMIARSRGWRGERVPVAVARMRLRMTLEADGTVIPSLAADVRRWRVHVDDLIRRLGARVSWSGAPIVGFYAWPELHRLELAPIVSPESYAAALHECGHVARPCRPTHRRVQSADPRSTFCRTCEPDAWRYAIAEALDWTPPMHEEMCRCLASYRGYGSGAEQQQIDQMCSPLGFRRAQLERLQGRAA